MKKKHLIIFTIFFIITLVVCFASMLNSSKQMEEIEDEDIYEKVEVRLGSIHPINEDFKSKLQDSEYYFSSNDSDIATIDKQTGMISAKKIGETVIYIMDSEDSSIIHAYKTVVFDDEMPRIKVQEVTVKKLSINKSKVTLGIGAKEKLTVAISPDNASNKDVVWESSNPNIVKVSTNGEITGLKEGKATVTVKLKDGDKKAKCEVTVKLIAVTAIKLNKTSTTISIGGTEKITATVSPSNAGDKRVTWTSSNSAIVSVTEDGVIKGLNVGTATITAKTIDGGKTASIKVQVKEISVTGIKLYKTNTTINVGASEKIIATVTPSNAGNKEITWSSSNTSIVTVSADGTVHGVKEGTATVTARTKSGGKTATITVKVIIPKVQVNGISLNKTATTLNIGSTEKLIATITPSNASNKGITWSSSNASVVTVTSDGTIKGIKEGTATVTAMTNDGGKTASTTVTVAPVAVTSVSLNKTSTSIKVGATEKVTATVSPSNATNKNVTWSSSNTAIATVATDGTIRGISVGTAIITVRTTDGNKTASITVTVTPIAVTGISLNKTSTSINLGETEKITATVSPSNATNKNVLWTSSNTDIATVATDGTVRGISDGITVITARTVDGGFTAKVTVSVKPVNVRGISLNKTSTTILESATEKITATITPSNATNKNIQWTSSNTAVATVTSDGTIRGVSSGTATITARTVDGGYTARVTVTVKQIIVQVTLDKQNGTGGTSSVTATYGSAMPSATAPTRSGYKVTYNYSGGRGSISSSSANYTFNGYYTSTGGNGTQYYNANMGSTRNWDMTSPTILYAYWTGPKSVKLPTATRYGYTFKGWYTSCTGGSKVGNTGDSYTPKATTTLCAQWARWQFKETYQSAGVCESACPGQCEYYYSAIAWSCYYSYNYAPTAQYLTSGKSCWCLA